MRGPEEIVVLKLILGSDRLSRLAVGLIASGSIFLTLTFFLAIFSIVRRRRPAKVYGSVDIGERTVLNRLDQTPQLDEGIISRSPISLQSPALTRSGLQPLNPSYDFHLYHNAYEAVSDGLSDFPDKRRSNPDFTEHPQPINIALINSGIKEATFKRKDSADF